MNTARDPSLFATIPPVSRSRPAITTVAPFDTNRSAHPHPIPRVPPVTTATVFVLLLIVPPHIGSRASVSKRRSKGDYLGGNREAARSHDAPENVRGSGGA